MHIGGEDWLFQRPCNCRKQCLAKQTCTQYIHTQSVHWAACCNLPCACMQSLTCLYCLRPFVSRTLYEALVASNCSCIQACHAAKYNMIKLHPIIHTPSFKPHTLCTPAVGAKTTTSAWSKLTLLGVSCSTLVYPQCHGHVSTHTHCETQV